MLLVYKFIQSATLLDVFAKHLYRNGYQKDAKNFAQISR